MKVKKAFKFRIYPNQEQQQVLAVQFGHVRFVYNTALAWRKEHYEQHGKGLNYNDTAQMLTIAKSLLPWLKEADSQILQQSLMNLNKAFENFFAGRANYPQFKSKYDKQSIRYPQRFKVNGSRIYLPKIGWVRAVFHRPIEGQMKNCTVTKTKSGKYFISIQCEVKVDNPQPGEGRIGIDLGLKDFVTLSTGEKVKPPQCLRKSERRLKIRQRRLSRKQKGSNNRAKARIRVTLQHERIANQRKDFHHKLSRDLVNCFGYIAFENLNIAGMLKNHHLAKSIADAGWSQFVGFCRYKQEWAGGQIEKRDRFFASSKLCNVCGQLNQSLKLSDREWLCTGCGTIHDRDENAALNILNGHTVGATEIYALGDMNPVGDSAQEAQHL